MQLLIVQLPTSDLSCVWSWTSSNAPFFTSSSCSSSKDLLGGRGHFQSFKVDLWALEVNHRTLALLTHTLIQLAKKWGRIDLSDSSCRIAGRCVESPFANHYSSISVKLFELFLFRSQLNGWKTQFKRVLNFVVTYPSDQWWRLWLGLMKTSSHVVLW